MDRELKAFLDSYETKGADDALLGRVLAQAEQIQARQARIPLRIMPVVSHHWPHTLQARVAACVLAAVMGFSSGMLTQPAQQVQQVAQQVESTAADNFIDDIISPPQTYEEIIL